MVFRNLNDSEAFSLIETLIGFALLVTVLTFGLQQFTVSEELQKIVEDRAMLSNIEDDIRTSLFRKESFLATVNENEDLKACMLADGEDCPRGRKPLELYLKPNQPMVLDYHGDGQACPDKEDCLIRVGVDFEGLCGQTPTCDQLSYLQLNYRIEVDDAVVRRSQLRRSFERRRLTDDALACDLDTFGRSQLAYRVSPAQVDCAQAPALKRELTGVKPADCKVGLEVLVGFDGAGNPLCEPIKFGGAKKKDEAKPAGNAKGKGKK